MFVPTASQLSTLKDRKCSYRITLSNSGKHSGKKCCQLIFVPTDQVFAFAYDDDETEAFNAAFKQIADVPDGNASAAALRERDARIAELEAQLAATQAPASPDSAGLDQPTTRRRRKSVEEPAAT